MLRATGPSVGLELGASEFQVQRSNRSATLPPRLFLSNIFFNVLIILTNKTWACLMRFISVFSGDIIMTGEGHKDWLSDCDFHPGYAPYSKSLSVAAAFVRVTVVIRSENSALFPLTAPPLAI